MSKRNIVKKSGQGDTETEVERRRAKNILRPTTAAVGIIAGFDQWVADKVNYNALCDELDQQCHAVSDGNLERPEAMLITQAHTLEAIFNNFARKAWAAGDRLDVAERFLRLALKAQSQCRTTLETLVTIKSPPMVVAKQANIAHGPQQINNSVELSCARDSAINPDSTMEALGEGYRTSKHRR